ncbi:MAG: TetR/AcrR family transcriptional regulator [Myxococcales bacterium]|nr:TetR/AcrR family transcriptional regulator [Myxococcales bacterium]MCB9526314.1 TetR/AcrR family transcriptional regulator [Myxococcales bacterium]
MGRRKQTAAELNRRRAELMGHAGAVFATHGYHGATMELIAEAAQCSPATLYTYFQGKADLFQAILDEVQEEILALLEADLPDGLGTRPTLLWMMERVGALIDRHRHLVVTRLHQLQGGHAQPTNARMRAGLVGFYREVFAAGQAAGEVRRDRDPLALAIAFDGMSVGVATQRLLEDESPLANIAELVDLFFEGAAP